MRLENRFKICSLIGAIQYAIRAKRVAAAAAPRALRKPDQKSFTAYLRFPHLFRPWFSVVNRSHQFVQPHAGIIPERFEDEKRLFALMRILVEDNSVSLHDCFKISSEIIY